MEHKAAVKLGIAISMMIVALGGGMWLLVSGILELESAYQQNKNCFKGNSALNALCNRTSEIVEVCDDACHVHAWGEHKMIGGVLMSSFIFLIAAIDASLHLKNLKRRAVVYSLTNRPTSASPLLLEEKAGVEL